MDQDCTSARAGMQTPNRKRVERASAIEEPDTVPPPLKIQKTNGYVLIVYCVIITYIVHYAPSRHTTVTGKDNIYISNSDTDVDTV